MCPLHEESKSIKQEAEAKLNRREQHITTARDVIQIYNAACPNQSCMLTMHTHCVGPEPCSLR